MLATKPIKKSIKRNFNKVDWYKRQKEKYKLLLVLTLIFVNKPFRFSFMIHSTCNQLNYSAIVDKADILSAWQFDHWNNLCRLKCIVIFWFDDFTITIYLKNFRNIDNKSSKALYFKFSWYFLSQNQSK